MLTDETTRFLLRVLREKREGDENQIELYTDRRERGVTVPGGMEAIGRMIQIYREEIEKTDAAIEELQANRAG